jgi:hypothetical protein
MQTRGKDQTFRDRALLLFEKVLELPTMMMLLIVFSDPLHTCVPSESSKLGVIDIGGMCTWEAPRDGYRRQRSSVDCQGEKAITAVGKDEGNL